jgi:hypothetical protein
MLSAIWGAKRDSTRTSALRAQTNFSIFQNPGRPLRIMSPDWARWLSTNWANLANHPRDSTAMRYLCPWHFLYFFPLPQGQGELRSLPFIHLLISFLIRFWRIFSFKLLSASNIRNPSDWRNCSGSFLALSKSLSRCRADIVLGNCSTTCARPKMNGPSAPSMRCPVCSTPCSAICVPSILSSALLGVRYEKVITLAIMAYTPAIPTSL